MVTDKIISGEIAWLITSLATETNFGLDMLRQSPATHSCVVSPISVMFALAMVQMGSKGKTKTQINKAISNGKTKLFVVITS
ncbi:hypothetical protein ANCDUO_23591 [Ancylostoma duodenale]|uniref:Serpin domain-containing protein n=1 Tax=Ancylostoma duodenale TaxID=51022 RepID=A0A0C2BRF2_9BILA|nr:hypothetical protein ANCDUO_23591 [Ancylostoma duodenale]